MNETNPTPDLKTNNLRYTALLVFLIVCGMLLAARLVYIFLADAERFPITTVKVAASYEHVTHQELEQVLSNYLDASFFSLSVNRLQSELNNINWIETAYVERVWPDTLKVKLVEKKPVAFWSDKLLTANGKLFQQAANPFDLDLPLLEGPESQQLAVLQVYEKLSKILIRYGLKAKGLHLSDNLSWMLTLSSGAKIYLGKKELETRLLRFCKAYPAVFAEKTDQLACVDLRYPRGMAVQWKQQTEQ